jgi:hypothetical protein
MLAGYAAGDTGWQGGYRVDTHGQARGTL